MDALLFAIGLLVIATTDLLAYLWMSRRLRALEVQAAASAHVANLCSRLHAESIGIDEKIVGRIDRIADRVSALEAK